MKTLHLEGEGLDRIFIYFNILLFRNTNQEVHIKVYTLLFKNHNFFSIAKHKMLYLENCQDKL